MPPADGRWLRLSLDDGRAVVVVCHSRREAGAAEALAFAERVAALFRGRAIGRARFGAPAIELDGRRGSGFRAVVTLPLSPVSDG